MAACRTPVEDRWGWCCRARWPGPHTEGSLLLQMELGGEVRAGEGCTQTCILTKVHQPPSLGLVQFGAQGLAASLMDLPGTEACKADCRLHEEVTCPSPGHCTIQALLKGCGTRAAHTCLLAFSPSSLPSVAIASVSLGWWLSLVSAPSGFWIPSREPSVSSACLSALSC